MPETKQLTAMMMLRERLQKVIDIEPSGTIEVIIKQIDTELLAVEKQQRKDSVVDAYVNGMYKGQDIYFGEDKIKLDVNYLSYSLLTAEDYYENTFNTK